jgi:hypothetical protein
MEPLLAYTVGTLLDEANLLRDSLLVSLECLHFEAYVHVNAVLWRVVFRELRGLTNSKGLEISPTELNTLYEYLYDLGTIPMPIPKHESTPCSYPNPPRTQHRHYATDYNKYGRV